MSDLQAVDSAGTSLTKGDIGTIKAEVIGDAGGTNMIYLRLLKSDDTRRTGAEQTDVIPIFDAELFTKD